MGYLRPTAMIVSASYRSGDGMAGPHWIEVTHAKALEIFEARGKGHLVSGIVDSGLNNERSFLVAWDGSKEGWADSDAGDEARAALVAWLREQGYGDGSSPLDWVEVQFGGDDREVIVLSHNGESSRVEA